MIRKFKIKNSLYLDFGLNLDWNVEMNFLGGRTVSDHSTHLHA